MKNTVDNVWAIFCGWVAFFAFLMAVCAIWTSGDTRLQFAYTGFLLLVIALGLAIPAIRKNKQ